MQKKMGYVILISFWKKLNFSWLKESEKSTNIRAGGNVNTIENVTINTTNVVDFCIWIQWFHGKHTSVNDGSNMIGDLSSSDGRSYILLHCCEELELLSREYSNDEGGDSSVATGCQTEIDTEHPDYLIQKGLAESVCITPYALKTA